MTPPADPPKIQALGITHEWAGSPARGEVDGVGWLEAWGTDLLGAMEALYALAARRAALQNAVPHDEGKTDEHV